MHNKRRVLGICGSASRNSANLWLLKYIADSEDTEFDMELIDDLSTFPHFRTDLTDFDVPVAILDLRNRISNADGILICTPEYVFSIPSGLKNILEWCVSTTVLSDKAIGLITASASGKMGHEELKMIMKTLQCSFTGENTLLIQGVKAKVLRDGTISDKETETAINDFIIAFNTLLSRV